MASFPTLPQELILEIFGKLGEHTLYCVAFTCRALHFPALHLLFRDHLEDGNLDINRGAPRFLFPALLCSLSPIQPGSIYYSPDPRISLQALLKNLNILARVIERSALPLSYLNVFVDEVSAWGLARTQDIAPTLQDLVNAAIKKGCRSIHYPTLEIEPSLPYRLPTLQRPTGSCSLGIASLRSFTLACRHMLEPELLKWATHIICCAPLRQLIIHHDVFRMETIREVLPQLYIPNLAGLCYTSDSLFFFLALKEVSAFLHRHGDHLRLLHMKAPLISPDRSIFPIALPALTQLDITSVSLPWLLRAAFCAADTQNDALCLPKLETITVNVSGRTTAGLDDLFAGLARLAELDRLAGYQRPAGWNLEFYHSENFDSWIQEHLESSTHDQSPIASLECINTLKLEGSYWSASLKDKAVSILPRFLALFPGLRVFSVGLSLLRILKTTFWMEIHRMCPKLKIVESWGVKVRIEKLVTDGWPPETEE